MSHNIGASLTTILRATQASLAHPDSIPIRLQTQAGILTISLVSVVNQIVTLQIHIDGNLDLEVTGNPSMGPEQQSVLVKELARVGITSDQTKP